MDEINIKSKIQIVREFLQEFKLPFNEEYREKDIFIFYMRLRGESTLYEGRLIVDFNRAYIILQMGVPNSIPDNLKSKIAEYIIRFNEIYIYGYYCMDYSAGQVYYQVFRPIGAESFDKEKLHAIIGSNINLSDIGIKGIFKILYGDVSAMDAINLIRNKT